MFMPKKIKTGEIEGMEAIQQQQQETQTARQQTASEKQIGNLTIFLIVLDVFSRFAWVRQLENRQSANVIKAFEDIFKTSNRRPVKLWTDRGGEFTGLVGKTPKKAKLEGVELYHTEGQSKATIAESFIKTLKNKIGRWMTENKTTDYIPQIHELVKEYNQTPHSVFKKKFTPEQASDPKHEDYLYKEFYEDARPRKVKTVDRITQKTPLKVGDLVRIARIKALGFEKGYTPNWTAEIFKIREIKDTIPTTFYLNDANDKEITGAFYRPEIQKTKFKMADWMGHSKERIKENARRGMEAVQKEATRQKEKKQRQRDRIKAAKQAEKQAEKEGKGFEFSETVRSLPNKSLTNFELIDICKHLKGWRGVFSRDALPEKPETYECGILNLDDSDGPGTHWTAWHRNKKNKFYFDSYGLPPPLEFQKYLKSPILYSSDQIQNPNSVICGHLCAHVLEKLNEGFHIQPVVNHLMKLKEIGYI